jgi:hypothetical protein
VPDYVCQNDGISNAAPICQHLPGAALDTAGAGLLLATLTPLALEVALTVTDELAAQAGHADALRAAHVQRAQHAADQARHRYLAVDPANRLVADALEADWNARLRELATARDDYTTAKTATAVLDDQQRARIQALATDFPALWHDPATPTRERKRLIRLLITDVTLTRGDHTITAAVRLPGGQHHTLNLAIPLNAWQALSATPTGSPGEPEAPDQISGHGGGRPHPSGRGSSSITGWVGLLREPHVVRRRKGRAVSQDNACHRCRVAGRGMRWRRRLARRIRRRRDLDRAATYGRLGIGVHRGIDQVGQAGVAVDAGNAECGEPEELDRGLGDAGVAAPPAVDARLHAPAEHEQRDAGTVCELDVVWGVLDHGSGYMVIKAAPVIPGEHEHCFRPSTCLNHRIDGLPDGVHADADIRWRVFVIGTVVVEVHQRREVPGLGVLDEP